jgi:putative oxidoreductase
MLQKLDALKPLGLLLLRLGVGIIFIYHGYPKLFGDTQKFLDAFLKMGFPPYFVYIAGIVEFFGGCLLIAGLFTRVAGLLMAGMMAVAIWKVHLGKGILAVSEYEFPLALAVGAFALVTTGAGAASLDYLLFKQKA